jgi:hypothetical protein
MLLQDARPIQAQRASYTPPWSCIHIHCTVFPSYALLMFKFMTTIALSSPSSASCPKWDGGHSQNTRPNSAIAFFEGSETVQEPDAISWNLMPIQEPDSGMGPPRMNSNVLESFLIWVWIHQLAWNPSWIFPWHSWQWDDNYRVVTKSCCKLYAPSEYMDVHKQQISSIIIILVQRGLSTPRTLKLNRELDLYRSCCRKSFHFQFSWSSQ